VKRALVIGGTGFIGLNLVDALIAHGTEVRVTRRRETAAFLLRKRRVEKVEASLEEPEKLRQAMDGCDTVFLTGAHYPRYSIDLDASIEIGGAQIRNACEAALAASVERFVYTSTISTLAPAPAGRPADERDVHSTRPEGSVYRALKWTMEQELAAYERRGLPAVTLLPGGCVGPNDIRVGTGAFIVAVARGLMPWYVDGIVNLVDVGDVARAHVAAAGAAPGRRYCVGGHDVRIGELLERVARRYGGSAPTLELDPDEARARADADERRAAEKRERVPVPREMVDMVTHGQPVSSALAERELGLRFTPIDTALDRAYQWFSSMKLVPAKEIETTDDHA
jgi:dihydroflavonol-4-reductase